MASVKISDLPSGTASENAVVPATNAAGTATEKITLGGIAGLVTDASQLTAGTLPDERISSSIARTADVVSNSGNVSAIQRLTQAEYDAIATPDADTLYVIVG